MSTLTQVPSEQPRRRRADGEESYRRILQAASDVAGERGYDGTTIAAVSVASGLPASSIYHYFANKDDLIAAVITSSFVALRSAITDEAVSVGRMHLEDVLDAVARAFADNPGFLRLGMMLSLERRPTEASARRAFLKARERASRYLVRVILAQWPEMDGDDAVLLATHVLAGVDGLFIVHEIGGGADLQRLFALHKRAAQQLAGELIESRRHGQL